MKNLILVAIIATLFGCAQTAPRTDVTHNWTASQKKLAKTFKQNNNGCTQNAVTVRAYEQCMLEHGYTLKLASR